MVSNRRDSTTSFQEEPHLPSFTSLNRFADGIHFFARDANNVEIMLDAAAVGYILARILEVLLHSSFERNPVIRDYCHFCAVT